MGHLILNDAHRYDPLGIDLHILYITGELWTLGGTGSAHHTHVEHTIAVIGIKMVGWYVDNDAFALCSYRLMTTPATAFHIHNDATAISQRTVFRKLLLQVEIVVVGGLNLVEQCRQAIVLHLPQHISGILSGGQIHGNIEQTAVFDYSLGRILFLYI